MRLQPYPIKHALPFVGAVHRRLPKIQGGMWSVALKAEQEVRGVAVVGRPNARMLDNGERLQVLRVAVVVGTPNGCSMLYGACSRAARAMGATDLFTYIHDDESGVSLRAAGWVEDTNFESDGGEWGRPSRARASTVEPGKKRRFWAPWSAYVKTMLTKAQDGLQATWRGRVWLNPPFGNQAAAWLQKLAQHGNGIALVPARTETAMFYKCVWHRADTVCFVKGRPHFHYPDGTRAPFNSGAPIALIAYGDLNSHALYRSNLGILVEACGMDDDIWAEAAA